MKKTKSSKKIVLKITMSMTVENTPSLYHPTLASLDPWQKGSTAPHSGCPRVS